MFRFYLPQIIPLRLSLIKFAGLSFCFVFALAFAAHLAADSSVPGTGTDHVAIFTAPPNKVPTLGMPDGPLLGNGDVGVVLGGPPEAQTFYIGKNDFWRCTPGDSKVMAVGCANLLIPALQGATYRQEQDMSRGEVRGTFTQGALTVHTRSWVQAQENLLLTELRCEGGPVPVSVRLYSNEQGVAPAQVNDNTQPASIGCEMVGPGRRFFDGEMANLAITNTVLSAKPDGQPENSESFDGRTTHRDMAVPKMDTVVSVAAWIKIAAVAKEPSFIVSKGKWNKSYSLSLWDGHLRWAVDGMDVQTDQPLDLGRWTYVAGTFNGKQMCLYVDGVLKASIGDSGGAAPDFFTRQAGGLPGLSRSVTVATRAVGASGLSFVLKPGEPVTIATSILSDLDAKDYEAAAKQRVAGLQPADIDKLSAEHQSWWSPFWSRSSIEIPDKVIENHWYCAQYIMASCSRAGKVAPGLWGNWVTTEEPMWNGDFHLNYNFEAPFYSVYAANHPATALPFFDAMTQSIPAGQLNAAKRGWKGVHFPASIGPWGMRPEGDDSDYGQRSNAAYAALNFIWYYQYTQDKEWLKVTGYPYLREVEKFWTDYLKFENGRYVIYNDSIHENSGPDFNPLLSLGLVRTLYQNMLVMSEDLDVDESLRPKWQDILAKISDWPLQEQDGKTIFRYTEKGMAWNKGNTLGIQQIFPAGAIGLDSSPKELEISRNMIDAMARWDDQNGACSWYTACARVGYPPEVILAHLRKLYDRSSMPNGLLNFGAGGIENVSPSLAVSEMLLQSYDGVLRLFPCWPTNLDARFETLRAVGAFLVSAEMKSGAITGVKITSEKGKDCTVVNPWPGKSVRVIRDGQPAESVTGERFTLKTVAGSSLELNPE
jgi:hypothetical protein